MSMVPPKIQELARQLLVFEAAHIAAPVEAGAPDVSDETTVRVIEGLRLRLIRLAGVEGFRSLLSRSLTLAKVEAPCLDAVRISANGTLEGFHEMEPGRKVAEQAGAVLVTHLLALLVTFIGESLTLRLVRDSWPEASMNDVDLKTEEKP